MASYPFPFVTLQIFVDCDLFSSYINWGQHVLSVIHLITSVWHVPCLLYMWIPTQSGPSDLGGIAEAVPQAHPKAVPARAVRAVSEGVLARAANLCWFPSAVWVTSQMQ